MSLEKHGDGAELTNVCVNADIGLSAQGQEVLRRAWYHFQFKFRTRGDIGIIVADDSWEWFEMWGLCENLLGLYVAGNYRIGIAT